jgi:hypothetical protein
MYEAWHRSFDTQEIRHVNRLEQLDVLLVANLVERNENISEALVRRRYDAKFLVFAKITQL